LSNSEYLICKADALLGRYRHIASPAEGREDSGFDAEFPVLTDVIDSLPPPRPRRDALATASSTSQAAERMRNTDVPFRVDALISAVIERIEPRLAPILEPLIRSRLQQAIGWIAQDIQAEVHAQVQDAVKTAIQEVIHEHLTSIGTDDP